MDTPCILHISEEDLKQILFLKPLAKMLSALKQNIIIVLSPKSNSFLSSLQTAKEITSKFQDEKVPVVLLTGYYLNIASQYESSLVIKKKPIDTIFSQGGIPLFIPFLTKNTECYSSTLFAIALAQAYTNRLFFLYQLKSPFTNEEMTTITNQHNATFCKLTEFQKIVTPLFPHA